MGGAATSRIAGRGGWRRFPTGGSLLITKKRYVGVLTDGKTLMKGVELVRKTACKFVQTRCRRVLDLVLADARVKEAASLLSHRPFQESFTQGLPVGFLPVIDILNQAYTDLREGRVPMGELCFSTELSRKLSAYKSTQMPHLAVYQKFVERNEELPQIHDRIQYVFVEPKGGVKGARKTEMAEDPAYAERHGVPVAVDHYFDKLLQGAANILQCLFDNNSGAAGPQTGSGWCGRPGPRQSAGSRSLKTPGTR